MSPTSGLSLDVDLAGNPLRIVATGGEGEGSGVPQYREEDVIGAEIVEPRDGERFVDIFTSWHKGGFIAEFVQDGFYNKAKNVDCTKPGEIRPGPRRLLTLDVGSGGAGIDNYGVSGLVFSARDAGLCAMVKRENVGGDNEPNDVRIRWINSSHALPAVTTQDDAISITAKDTTALTGFTTAARPLVFKPSGAGVRIFYPYGDGYRRFASGVLDAAVTTPCHQLLVLGNRGFKVSFDLSTNVLELSNIDVNADWAVAANWTTPVEFPVSGRATSEQAEAALSGLGLIPFIGSPQGIYALGTGGVPFNLNPSLPAMNLPYGLGNFGVLQTASGGIVTGMFGRGHLLWFNQRGGVNIGPSIVKLASIDNVRIMEIFEAPNLDLWVLVNPYERANADGVWELWIGKRKHDVSIGPGAYAWHPLLLDDNTNEGGPDNANRGNLLNALSRPFLPFAWDHTGPYEIAIATGHGDDKANLTFVDGEMFFDFTNYEHEDHSASYNVDVIWEGGRYARHDRRVERHWTALHFQGKNLSAGSASKGGRIKVMVSFDGGAFANPPDGETFLTVDAQTVPVDTVARDVEVQLTWQLDGETGDGAAAMRNAPATITEIQYEGREVPRQIRRISMVVEADAPAQAGGVRQKIDAPNLQATLRALAVSTKQTFKDPYKTDRTVVVLPAQILTPEDAERLQVPPGSIALVLLEVPS